MNQKATVHNLKQASPEAVWEIIADVFDEVDQAYYETLKGSKDYNMQRMLVQKIQMLDDVKDKLRARLDVEYTTTDE